MPAVIERGASRGRAGRGAAGRRSGRDPTAPRDPRHRIAPSPSRRRWVVRMDHPYTALVRTVLAIQRFRPYIPRVHDTGCRSTSFVTSRHTTRLLRLTSRAMLAADVVPAERDRTEPRLPRADRAGYRTPPGACRARASPWRHRVHRRGHLVPRGTYSRQRRSRARRGRRLGLRASPRAMPTVRSHASRCHSSLRAHGIETQTGLGSPGARGMGGRQYCDAG